MDVFDTPAELPPVEESPLLQSTYGRVGRLLEHAPEDDASREYPDLFADADRTPETPAPAPAQVPAPATLPGQFGPRPPYTADLPATHTDRLRAYAAFHSAAHDAALRTSPAGYAELQRELQKRPFASLIEIGALARRMGFPETLVASLRDTSLAAGVLVGAPPVAVHHGPVGSAAALAATRAEAKFTEVPEATRSYFQKDQDGQLLWYAAAPLPHAAATVDGTTRMPMPSVAYMERLH